MGWGRVGRIVVGLAHRRGGGVGAYEVRAQGGVCLVTVTQFAAEEHWQKVEVRGSASSKWSAMQKGSPARFLQLIRPRLGHHLVVTKQAHTNPQGATYHQIRCWCPWASQWPFKRVFVPFLAPWSTAILRQTSMQNHLRSQKVEQWPPHLQRVLFSIPTTAPMARDTTQTHNLWFASAGVCPLYHTLSRISVCATTWSLTPNFGHLAHVC